MADPRFHRCTVTTRAAHPCHWCPDEIPAGATAETWACREADGVCRTRWAHPYCEEEAVAEIGEAFGDDDDAVLTPDPGLIPRMFGFFTTFESWQAPWNRDLGAAEVERLRRLWARCQPGGDLAELAGTVRRGVARG